MPEQSLLARQGMRSGILGASAALALCAPLATGNYDVNAATDASRIGWFFDRTAAAEKIGHVVMGTEALALGVTAATFTGKVVGPMSTTAYASLRAPHGVAPTTPVDGDLWTTTAGLFARINGATVGPFGTGGGGVSGSGAAGQVTFWSGASAVSGDAALLWDNTTKALSLVRGTVATASTGFAQSATWNNGAAAFFGWDLDITNTASSAASLLLRFRVAAAEVFSVSPAGDVLCSGDLGAGGAALIDASFLWSSSAFLLTLDSDPSVSPPGPTVLDPRMRFLALDGNGSGLESLAFGSNDPALGLLGRSVGGTRGAPTATTDGSPFLLAEAAGYDGTSYANAGHYRIIANGNWTPTSHADRHQFRVVPTGSTAASSLLELLDSQIDTLGTLNVGAGLRVARTNITANYTLLATDIVIYADATAGNIVITAASLGTTFGRLIIIKKIDVSANTVTFTPTGGTVDSAATLVLTALDESYTLHYRALNTWALI